MGQAIKVAMTNTSVAWMISTRGRRKQMVGGRVGRGMWMKSGGNVTLSWAPVKMWLVNFTNVNGRTHVALCVSFLSVCHYLTFLIFCSTFSKQGTKRSLGAWWRPSWTAAHRATVNRRCVGCIGVRQTHWRLRDPTKRRRSRTLMSRPFVLTLLFARFESLQSLSASHSVG